MKKFFLRIDYSYKLSPVQHFRVLCETRDQIMQYWDDFSTDDYQIILFKVERCF